MKIRKFNENIHSDLDPFKEEIWDNSNYSEMAGICYNCGSENIDYYYTEFYDEQIAYEYFCNDCKKQGQEVYNLVFEVNESR